MGSLRDLRSPFVRVSSPYPIEVKDRIRIDAIIYFMTAK